MLLIVSSIDQAQRSFGAWFSGQQFECLRCWDAKLRCGEKSRSLLDVLWHWLERPRAVRFISMERFQPSLQLCTSVGPCRLWEPNLPNLLQLPNMYSAQLLAITHLEGLLHLAPQIAIMQWKEQQTNKKQKEPVKERKSSTKKGRKEGRKKGRKEEKEKGRKVRKEE